MLVKFVVLALIKELMYSPDVPLLITKYCCFMPFLIGLVSLLHGLSEHLCPYA